MQQQEGGPEYMAEDKEEKWKEKTEQKERRRVLHAGASLGGEEGEGGGHCAEELDMGHLQQQQQQGQAEPAPAHPHQGRHTLADVVRALHSSLSLLPSLGTVHGLEYLGLLKEPITHEEVCVALHRLSVSVFVGIHLGLLSTIRFP